MGALVLIMAGSTAVILGASFRQHRGIAWADDICSAASFLCASPGWLVALTIITALLYFYRVSLSA
jgi:hypothetical protein